MPSLTIDGVRIAYAEIAAGGTRLTRRERERAVVGQLVDELLGTEAVVTHDRHGAPHTPGAYLSITHSQRLAAVAVSADRPIGIDAEEWRPTLRRVAAKYLSPALTADALSDAELLREWTVKEAVYKAAAIPGLPFTDIQIEGDVARVASYAYSLHSVTLGATLLTLAVSET